MSLIILISPSDRTEFESEWTAGCGALKLENQYTLKNPDTVEHFDGQPVLEYLIPFLQHTGPLLAFVLGQWLSRKKATAIINGNTFKDMTVEEIQLLQKEVVAAQKTTPKKPARKASRKRVR